VRAAIALATELGSDHSCAPEQGRLLSVLARGCTGRRIGETGTGCGVGLAWMVDATDASTLLASIERDPTRWAASAALFGDRPNVRVLHGNWTELRDHGPFDLLVLDGGGKGKEPEDDPPLDPTDGWVSVGGTIVLDDFTPADQPGAAAHDQARRYWLGHPALQATELRLSPRLDTVLGEPSIKERGTNRQVRVPQGSPPSSPHPGTRQFAHTAKSTSTTRTNIGQTKDQNRHPLVRLARREVHGQVKFMRR
jgi:predicted O-methyltransferase YrrM